MSIETHVVELRKKHQTLSERIEAEQRSPASDDLTIATLKREKLKLKDEISRLETSVH